MATTTTLGKVSLTMGGNYSPTATYDRLTVVRGVTGNSYVTTVDGVSGISPGVTSGWQTYWQLFAEDGSGGGGGSTVTVTQVLSSGTKIATIGVDGTDTDLFAPSGGGGSEVIVTPIQTTGTKIAEIDVDGTTSDLYAPNELPTGATAGDVLMKTADGLEWSDDVTELKSAVNGKQAAPATAGTAGQVLGLDNSLNPVWVNQSGGGGGVSDVQINGTSIVSGGVADIPTATASQRGLVKVVSADGIGISSGAIYIDKASSAQIKSGTANARPIVAANQHEATFYGLAKAAGDSTQSASSNPVGTYTNDAKTAIKNMLGISDGSFELIRFIELTEDAQSVYINSDDTDASFSLSGFLIAINSVGATGANSEGYLKIALNSNSVTDFNARIMDMTGGIRKQSNTSGIAVYGAYVGVGHFTVGLRLDGIELVNSSGGINRNIWGSSSYPAMSGAASVTSFCIGSDNSATLLGAGTRIAIYGHRNA